MKLSNFLIIVMSFAMIQCTNKDNFNPEKQKLEKDNSESVLVEQPIELNEDFEHIPSKSTLKKGRNLSSTELLNTKYCDITFKGSHNSYERDESISEQLNWYTKNGKTSYNCCCMGLEFDIWRHTSSFTPWGNISDGFWTVNHLTGSSGRKLSDYLGQLKSWHNAHPNHFPIMVKLDVKSSNGGYQNFHDQIDTYLKKYMGENLIFKPYRLFKERNLDLAQNVIRHGWPKVKDMSGKFIFVLTGNGSWGSTYATKNLKDSRYCFTMSEKAADNTNVYPPSSGNIVFFNFHIYDRHKSKWMTTIPRFAAKDFITRVYIANSESNFNNSIRARVNCISTDKVRNHSWAVVTDYYKFDRNW